MKKKPSVKSLYARIGELDAIIRAQEAEKERAYRKWQEETPTYSGGGVPLVFCSGCRRAMDAGAPLERQPEAVKGKRRQKRSKKHK